MDSTPVALVCLEKDAVALLWNHQGFELVGIIDPAAEDPSDDLPVLGGDDDWEEIRRGFPGLRLCIAADDPAIRRRLAGHYGLDVLADVISSNAYLAPGASLGPGCLVQRDVTVMTEAAVGTACKLNIGATLHHDCVTGDYCTLAPGCRLLGNVRLGDRVLVGAGAIVMPRLRVGKGAVIGAGAVVTKDVPEGVTVAGVPAKKVR